MDDKVNQPEDPGTLPAPTEPSLPTLPPDSGQVLPPTDELGTKSHRHWSHPPGAPIVEGYSPVRPLGKGTYGEVWLYTEARSNRKVAIKFLTRQTTEQWLTLQAEVIQLAMMDATPHIIQLKRVEPDATPPYYVMSYAEGGSLAQRLHQGPVPMPEALDIFEKITRALSYVHEKGVRHCDLKPGNVLLDARDQPLLADFGQALLAEDSARSLGTLFFMAPEQATLEEISPDARWDVYALGALFYTMVTGHPPRCQEETRLELFRIKDQKERLQLYNLKLAQSPSPQAHRQIRGVDRALAGIIDRCLALCPKDRYSTAVEVLQALRQRDHARQLRRLLLPGIFIPLLLLIVFATMGRWGIKRMTESSEQALTHQWQENARTTSRLLANVIEKQLVNRLHTVKSQATDPELIRLIHEDQPRDLEQHLKRAHERSQVYPFDRWMVLGANGHLRASYRASPDLKQLEVDCSLRDWFHGQGDRDAPRGGALSPVKCAHISHPYLDCSGKLALAISVPVYDPDVEKSAEPIGVLAACFGVEHLSDVLHDAKIQHGFLALVNDRCQYVIHGSLPAITPKRNQAPVAHLECPFLRSLVQKRLPDTGALIDPIDHQRYLVGCSPCRGRTEQTAHWGVIVQHRTDAALRPVTEMRSQLWSIAWIGFAVLAISTLVLWLGLLRLLHRARAA